MGKSKTKKSKSRKSDAETGETAEADTLLSQIRASFRFAPNVTPLDCMLVSSHPKAVRRAIHRYSRQIDADPDGFLRDNIVKLFRRVADRAARYLGLPADAKPSDFVRQTESTTVGLAELYNSIRVRPGEEFLTSVHDFFSTREILNFLGRRTGVSARQIRLFEAAASASEDEILENLRKQIRPYTRVLALTWVLSNTGLKLPAAAIGRLVAEINQGRSEGDRLLFCLDGVHGLGVEDFRFEDLGCDFLVAGCHKWFFGPRGTAILCGRPESWRYVGGTVPSLNPLRFPGGVLPYEYHFALAEAFDFHTKIGKDTVERHTVGLAQRLKDGLTDHPGIFSVVTPLSRALSSGIVCCDVFDKEPEVVVGRLRNEYGILASVSSEDADRRKYVRFSPSILNTEDQIDKTLAAMTKIATSS